MSREYVLKKSLSGSLREPFVMNEINKWVLTTSKAINKASLIFNRMLIHCLHNNISLPDLTNDTIYNRCVNADGKTYNTNPTPQITDTKNLYFSSFPIIPKDKGNAQAYSYARDMYKNNFLTSLKTNFRQRQYNYISTWLLHNDIEFSPKLVKSIQAQVNNWTYYKSESISNSLIQSFISSQQKLLNLDISLCDKWIEKHPNNVVTYFYSILKYIEKYEFCKKFTLAPISSIKLHFLRIDVVVLYNILKNCKLIQISEQEFKANKDLYFSTFFNYKKTNFSHIIDTDGISVCFHYKKPIVKQSECKYPNIRVIKRVIGIDPGRTNIIYAAEKLPDKTVKTYKLTRKQYYNSSGITKCKEKSKNWQKQIQEEEQIYAQYSIKTINTETWNLFIDNYISVYNKLWSHKTQQKYGRERFRVYTLKRKTLDIFFNTFLSKNLPIPDIAYGSAGFKCNGRNELSAPKSSILERCKKKFEHVKEIDEYRTTKVCRDCNNVLQQVRISSRSEAAPSALPYVRGLSRCCSTECSQTSYKGRDKNAALNIARCYLGRPTMLLRDRKEKLERPTAFLISMEAGRNKDCRTGNC